MPLTPPPDAAPNIPPKYKEVGTKDAAPDVFKLNRLSSKWTGPDLDYLGVEYQYNEFDEIKTPEDYYMPSDLANCNFPLLPSDR